MSGLYPLKFLPIFKEKVWGGQKIKDVLDLNFGKMKFCGEAWMLSGLEGDESMVCNGFLEGNSLPELLEIYMGDLVGEKVYENSGNEFPLLFKWIDAQQDLSLQVHPQDALAMKKHNCNGKSELWYIKAADPKSILYCGLKNKIIRNAFIDKLGTKEMCEDLAEFEVKADDIYYIPSGTVHGLGKGILLAEIQQSSDITYRLYDWDRKNENGDQRDLHIGDGLDAIAFEKQESGLIPYARVKNITNEVIRNPYFETNYIRLTQALEKDFSEWDSFVVYLCTDGNGILKADEHSVEIRKGELVLIPACMNKVALFPDINGMEVLETSILHS